VAGEVAVLPVGAGAMKASRVLVWGYFVHGIAEVAGVEKFIFGEFPDSRSRRSERRTLEATAPPGYCATTAAALRRSTKVAGRITSSI